MTETHNCPFCAAPLKPTYLYVRGIGAALHRSDRPDVGLLSRSGLEQINLADISQTDTGAQAVIESMHCESCDSISFKASN
ncbi:MAG: hypothetical protein HKN77_04385 [Woeseiaceae bacterium]|nr:hypothetical protein [Woeseiaceae bacterium]